MSVFTKHLDSVGETYFQHLGHAFSFASSMFVGSVACLIHAIFPFLCEKTGSNRIIELHERMVDNRANLTPAAKKSAAKLQRQAAA